MNRASGTLSSVTALLPQDGVGGPRWPRLVDANIEDQQAALRLWVPTDLYWFGGHFDGRPVLPGVVQTHWAATLAAHIFAPDAVFTGIDGLKFHRLVSPAVELTLRLSVAEDIEAGASIRFVFHADAVGERVSAGRLRYQ